MTLRVGDGKNGNKAELWGYLRGDGGYSVDWGDGNIESVARKRRRKGINSLRPKHSYSKESISNNSTFEVTVSTEMDNLISFYADAGKMIIEDIDISQCQELEMLRTWDIIESLDITKNPNIREIFAGGGSVKSLDFSGSYGLERLEINGGDIQNLDLSNCASLSYIKIETIKGLELLNLSGCPRLCQMGLFKNLHLKEVFLHEKCRLVNFHLVGDFTEDTKDRIRAAWDNYKYTDLDMFNFL